jgi:hypothetical protein
MPRFLALCPHCGKKVTAHTMLNGDDLRDALGSGSDVEVMHTAPPDHRWNLSGDDKENLRNQIANGLVSP